MDQEKTVSPMSSSLSLSVPDLSLTTLDDILGSQEIIDCCFCRSPMDLTDSAGHFCRLSEPGPSGDGGEVAQEEWLVTNNNSRNEDPVHTSTPDKSYHALVLPPSLLPASQMLPPPTSPTLRSIPLTVPQQSIHPNIIRTASGQMVMTGGQRIMLAHSQQPQTATTQSYALQQGPMGGQILGTSLQQINVGGPGARPGQPGQPGQQQQTIRPGMHQVEIIPMETLPTDHPQGALIVAQAEQAEVQLENGALLCDICAKSFSNLQNLRRHRYMHSEEKHYACGFCGEKFKWAGLLSYHIDNNHSDNIYVCDICQKKFKNSQTLKKHKTMMSACAKNVSRPKDLKCKLCNKVSSNASNYKRHEKTCQKKHAK